MEKTFIARYYGPNGRAVWNRRKGESMESVKSALLDAGLTPILVFPDISTLMKKVRNAGLRDQESGDLFNELGGLTLATGSLPKSLSFLYDRTNKKSSKFKYKSFFKNAIYKAINFYYADKYKNKNKFIKAAIKDINAGYTFSKTLEVFEFDELTISLTKVGENTGDLPETFKKIARYYDTKKGYKKSFISTLSYPALLFLLLIGTFIIFLFYVIPAFAGFFRTFPHIPAKTLFVLNTFANLRHFFILYAGSVVIVLISMLYIWFSNYKNIRQRVFNKLAELPIIGYFFKFNYLRWYFYQFSILISSGQTYVSVLEYFRKITTNEYFRSKFDVVYAYLIAGRTLADSFAASEILRPEDLDSIQYSEVSGNLDETMMRLSVRYGEITDMEIKIITKTLNGVALALIVAFILFMFMAVYLPMISGVVNLPSQY